MTALVFALAINAPRAFAGIIWQENFEGTAIGTLPPTLISASGAGSTFGVTTNSARAGTKSLSLKLTYASGGNNYRAEVVTRNPGYSYKYDTEYWVGFSQYLKNYGNDSSPEMVLQAHASSKLNAVGCVGPPDSFAAVVSRGVYDFRVDQSKAGYCTNKSTSATPNTSAWSGVVVSDQWVDWVMHFKYAPGTGFYEFWRNGTLAASITNLNNAPTLMHPCCTPIPTTDLGYYPKWGIYKWVWKRGPTSVTSREMYMDEIKVWEGPGGSYAAVAPGGGMTSSISSASGDARATHAPAPPNVPSQK